MALSNWPSSFERSGTTSPNKETANGILSRIRGLVSCLPTYRNALVRENGDQDMAIVRSIESIVSTIQDDTLNQSPSQWRSYETDPVLPNRLVALATQVPTPRTAHYHHRSPAFKDEPSSPSIKLEPSDDEARAALKRGFDSGYESNDDSSETSTRSSKRRRSEDLSDIKPKIESLSDSENRRKRSPRSSTRRTGAPGQSCSRHGRNSPPRPRKPMLPYNLKASQKLQRTYAFVEHDFGKYVAWLPDHPNPQAIRGLLPPPSPRSDVASDGSFRSLSQNPGNLIDLPAHPRRSAFAKIWDDDDDDMGITAWTAAVAGDDDEDMIHDNDDTFSDSDALSTIAQADRGDRSTPSRMLSDREYASGYLASAERDREEHLPVPSLPLFRALPVTRPPPVLALPPVPAQQSGSGLGAFFGCNNSLLAVSLPLVAPENEGLIADCPATMPGAWTNARRESERFQEQASLPSTSAAAPPAAPPAVVAVPAAPATVASPPTADRPARRARPAPVS